MDQRCVLQYTVFTISPLARLLRCLNVLPATCIRLPPTSFYLTARCDWGFDSVRETLQMSPLFQPSPLSTMEGSKGLFGSAPGAGPSSLPRFADSNTRLPNTSADTAETQFGSSPVAVPSRPARVKRAPVAADDFIRGRSAPDPAAPIVENASLPERRSRRATSSVSAVTRLLKSPNSESLCTSFSSSLISALEPLISPVISHSLISG